MKGFKEVAPGVMVNTRRGFKIKIPHPNKDETASMGDGRTLFVFSTEELAKGYMEKVGLEEGFPKCFSWEELVDKFGQSQSNVLVDHKGEVGYYSNVPLKKGI